MYTTTTTHISFTPTTYHYREYYALRVEAWITEDSTPTYMLRVERSLEEEKARVAEYLNTESEPKLLQV